MSNVVHDPAYIAWVKRSLNRLLFAGLRTDGQVTLLYRLWVREFQYITGCRLGGNGSVDKKTQDYLIAINNVSTNHSSRVYIAWAQQALLRLKMGKGFTANGEMDKATRKAIEKFQLSVKHKHIDGVIGPKTEFDLWKKVPDLVIPGFYPGGAQPKPKPHPNDDWHKTKVDKRALDEVILSWINLYIRELDEEPLTILDATARRTIICMLHKLKTGFIRFEYSPNNYDFLYMEKARNYAINVYGDMPVQKHVDNALVELRENVKYFSLGSSSQRYIQFKEAIYNLYRYIDNGVREVIYQISNGGGVKEGRYAALEEWYDHRYADKTSIVSCIPPPAGSPWHPF
jgi:hypothetical protein